MSKFYKILWSLAIVFFVITAIVVSLGLLLVGAAGVGLFGIYRYYLLRKRLREFAKRPYASGEVIDLKTR